MSLTAAQAQRYRRHLLLPEVGPAGQAALGAAKVLLVGAGGLGAPAALYLAAAGVGTLGLVDHDRVDPSNLQRQLLFREGDVGRPKLAAAVDTLAEINPHVTVVPHDCWLRRENALELVGAYDLVLNGCDNFPTRYLLNDACHLAGRPCVDGSIYRFEGQVTVYETTAGGPCYRCRFPAPPPPGSVPSCAEAGVLGVLPGIVGSWQAAEAIKWILRRAGTANIELLVGRMLAFDVLAGEVLEFRYDRDPACPLCGDAPTVRELIDYDQFCNGSAAAPEASPRSLEISPADLAAKLAAGAECCLVDVRETWEWDLCRIGGALLAPLGELTAHLDRIPRDRLVVTYCHAGVRSMRALERLRAAGYEQVQSLAGGIEAWAQQIDPQVPRY
ncbi:MAG: ThiF family adenylyltransferase [Fimbriimonadaceae bacterium]|nr:ThiF family adenylyltransferase [Fimbriimonadaceae bacterium]